MKEKRMKKMPLEKISLGKIPLKKIFFGKIPLKKIFFGKIFYGLSRYRKSRRIFLSIFVSISCLTITIPLMILSAQSLWQDHNPYILGTNIRSGMVLKLEIDEPVQIIYDYENLTDEKIDLNLVPDRTITSFLPPAEFKRSIIKKYTNRLRSRSRIKLKMAVTVLSDPVQNIVTISGTKYLGQENNISRQQIEVNGKVHIEDIGSNRNIHSNHIADLRIVIIGAPVPRSRNFQLNQKQQEQQGVRERAVVTAKIYPLAM